MPLISLRLLLLPLTNRLGSDKLQVAVECNFLPSNQVVPEVVEVAKLVRNKVIVEDWDCWIITSLGFLVFIATAGSDFKQAKEDLSNDHENRNLQHVHDQVNVQSRLAMVLNSKKEVEVPLFLLLLDERNGVAYPSGLKDPLHHGPWGEAAVLARLDTALE